MMWHHMTFREEKPDAGADETTALFAYSAADCKQKSGHPMVKTSGFIVESCSPMTGSRQRIITNSPSFLGIL